jgi:hypothetical protein
MVDTGLTGDFCNRVHYNMHTQEIENDNDVALAGSVYFCESCVVNMGMVVGMLPEYKVKELNEKLKHLEDANEKLQRKILGQEQLLNGYRTLESAGLSDVVTTGGYLSEPIIDEGSEASAIAGTKQGQLFTESDSGTVSGNSETDEPVSDSDDTGLSADNNVEPGERGDEPTYKRITGADSGRLGF